MTKAETKLEHKDSQKPDHALWFTFYLINTSIDIARLLASLNPQTAADIYLQIKTLLDQKRLLKLHICTAKTPKQTKQTGPAPQP